MTVSIIGVFGLVGCGAHTGEVQESTPTPTASSTPPEVSAPGAHSGLRDSSTEASSDTDQAVQDFSDDLGFGDDPRSQERTVENPEDQRDRAGARDALARGQEASAQLDDGFTQQYAAPEDVRSLDASWWTDRERAVGERFAQIATGFRPGEDFNRDEAMVRASHLLIPAAQLDAVGQYPALDASWRSAEQCNAEVEVEVAYQELPEEERVAMPTFRVIAEYRWVNGDDGCDIQQPDYFYEYSLSMGSEGLLTRVDRTTLDEALVDRPSGW